MDVERISLLSLLLHFIASLTVLKTGYLKLQKSVGLTV